jgi:integrase
VKINSRTVAALKLPANASDVIHFDSELSGFGVRLRRSTDGRLLRSFVAQYRHAGRTRRVKLDGGNALSAEQARSAAKTILAQVALGEDPQAERLGRRDARSLRSVADEYLAAKRTSVRPTTFRAMQSYLTGGYFRPLHGMPLDQITRADIAGRLIVISRENGENTAMHCRKRLSALCSWAMGMGMIEANPTIGTISPEGSKARERVLTDAELAKIWRACGDDDHGRITRLLMLTACRRQEVGGMRWPELDFERGVWTIPGERIKNHREHSLPLPAPALAIITAVPRVVDRDHLFGVRGEGFVRWSAGKAALDERAGIAAWTLHDLRRTCATRLADLGVQPHVIETLLNHHSGHKNGVAGIYNRSSYTNEVRAALAMWADHIGALTSGRSRKIAAIRPARAA